MDTKTKYILEGNFKKGFPELYNKEANNVYELHKNFEELREAVAEELTIDILRDQNIDYLNWDYISCWRKMTGEEIREFANYIKWDLIKEYQIQYLNDDIKREFRKELNWEEDSK